MKEINLLITKAVMDEDFRSEFLKNPIKLAEEYGLSKNEIAHLSNIDFSELEQINIELEERLSKSFIELPNLGNDLSRAHTSHSNSENEPIHTSLTDGNAGGHNSFFDNDGIHDSSSHSSW